jgi:hypothetical protein
METIPKVTVTEANARAAMVRPPKKRQGVPAIVIVPKCRAQFNVHHI